MPLKPGMRATVYLKCKAALGGTIATGKVTVTLGSASVTQAFRIGSRRSGAITIKLPSQARPATTTSQNSAFHAAVRISTREASGAPESRPAR